MTKVTAIRASQSRELRPERAYRVQARTGTTNASAIAWRPPALRSGRGVLYAPTRPPAADRYGAFFVAFTLSVQAAMVLMLINAL